MNCDPYCATILRATANYMCCRNPIGLRYCYSFVFTSTIPALYSTRTVLYSVFRRSSRGRGTRWVAYRTYVLTVLLCTFTTLYGTSTVRYIGPSSFACTTVLHSYRTLFSSKHYSPFILRLYCCNHHHHHYSPCSYEYEYCR